MATLEEIQRELRAKGVIRLKVKVTPKGGRDEITGFLSDGTLKVRVQAAPERGKANAAVCEVVARALGVRPAQVSVAAGAASAAKILVVKA